MQLADANYANTDYSIEGGIDMGKGNKKKGKDDLPRATAIPEAKKHRSYDPFFAIQKDVTDKKFCPDCKKQAWLGRDTGSLAGSDRSSFGSSFGVNGAVNLRGGGGGY